MNLETIQSMWEKDSQIDKFNIHDESAKIPSLHAKYYDIYNSIRLLKEKAVAQESKVDWTDTITILAKHLQKFTKKNLSHIR